MDDRLYSSLASVLRLKAVKNYFLCGILLFIMDGIVQAEPKWIAVEIERTPIVDKRGRKVDRPVFYAKDRMRLTKGGEWVIPKEIKGEKILSYHQREKDLLVLVDTIKSVSGTLATEEDALRLKFELSGTTPMETKKAESGVTK